MGEGDIRKKVYQLIQQEALQFEERDVVYILVELYKLTERKYGKKETVKKFPHIVFFRNWIVHTGLQYKQKIKISEVVRQNNGHERISLDELGKEISSLLDDKKTWEIIEAQWSHFSHSLFEILKDQPWKVITEESCIIEVVDEKGLVTVRGSKGVRSAL